MNKQHFKKVWLIPLLLAILTLFGLLSALLGTGYWYDLSWAAMTLPPAIIVWKVWGKRLSGNK